MWWCGGGRDGWAGRVLRVEQRGGVGVCGGWTWVVGLVVGRLAEEGDEAVIWVWVSGEGCHNGFRAQLVYLYKYSKSIQLPVPRIQPKHKIKTGLQVRYLIYLNHFYWKWSIAKILSQFLCLRLMLVFTNLIKFGQVILPI